MPDGTFFSIGITAAFRSFADLVVELDQLVEHPGHLLFAGGDEVSPQLFPSAFNRPFVDGIVVEAGLFAHFLLG